jgi:ABC-type hemin transport system ATPase subunit
VLDRRDGSAPGAAVDTVVEASGLRMRYGPLEVLDGIDFSVRRGEVIALLGPNGAGKTTTIEILEGFRLRSALLPAGAAAVEITRSWRHPAAAAVLGVWAVAGLMLAPAVLRRMARRESGSSMEARRQRRLARI